MTTFTNQTQKDRRAYSDYWGIEIGDVYYCDECGYWTHNDEDDFPVCKCAQGVMMILCVYCESVYPDTTAVCPECNEYDGLMVLGSQADQLATRPNA